MIGDDDLRDCFAMFTLCGIVMRGIGDDVIEEVASNAYKMADAMMEARNRQEPEVPEVGIVAVKTRRRK